MRIQWSTKFSIPLFICQLYTLLLAELEYAPMRQKNIHTAQLYHPSPLQTLDQCFVLLNRFRKVLKRDYEKVGYKDKRTKVMRANTHRKERRRKPAQTHFKHRLEFNDIHIRLLQTSTFLSISSLTELKEQHREIKLGESCYSTLMHC